jgi:hypothetical protein
MPVAARSVARRAVKLKPVAVRRVARRAVREKPVIFRSLERGVSLLLLSNKELLSEMTLWLLCRTVLNLDVTMIGRHGWRIIDVGRVATRITNDLL